MSNKDIQLLMALAEEQLERSFTEATALSSLVDAGLIDQHGNPTAPYQTSADEQA